MSEDAQDPSPVDPNPKSPTGNPFPPKPEPTAAETDGFDEQPEEEAS
jgi:hypothetical protein